MIKPFQPKKFEGSYKNVSFHTMICFDASFVKATVALCLKNNQLKEFGIFEDETYELIDWLTREVVTRAFPHVYIVGHPHSDKFQQFYDQELYGFEFRLRHTAGLAALQGKSVQVAKVLCMDERSLIALGM